MNSTKQQIGGTHYKDLAIQPVEYIHKNSLGFCEGNVVKYVTRWKQKGGIEDLKKARHFLDLLIDMETDDTLQAVENLRQEHDSSAETDKFYQLNHGAF